MLITNSRDSAASLNQEQRPPISNHHNILQDHKKPRDLLGSAHQYVSSFLLYKLARVLYLTIYNIYEYISSSRALKLIKKIITKNK